MNVRATAAAALCAAAVPAGLVAALGGAGSADVTTGDVGGLQARYTAVVRQVSPEVVQIETSTGLGSGIAFDRNGNIVTNAHVVGNATRFVVTLPAGDEHPATLVGTDRGHDLAVIRVQGARPRVATFGRSSQLDVGDIVLAIGNPLGLRSSVTEGIVSSLRRTVSEGDGVRLSPVIQTSAAINPGNSGGALVDLTGRVIGIPTLAALDPDMGDAQAPGIGFAIPSDTVVTVARGLIQR